MNHQLKDIEQFKTWFHGNITELDDLFIEWQRQRENVNRKKQTRIHTGKNDCEENIKIKYATTWRQIIQQYEYIQNQIPPKYQMKIDNILLKKECDYEQIMNPEFASPTINNNNNENNDDNDMSLASEKERKEMISIPIPLVYENPTKRDTRLKHERKYECKKKLYNREKRWKTWKKKVLRQAGCCSFDTKLIPSLLIQ